MHPGMGTAYSCSTAGVSCSGGGGWIRPATFSNRLPPETRTSFLRDGAFVQYTIALSSEVAQRHRLGLDPTECVIEESNSAGMRVLTMGAAWVSMRTACA